MIAGNGQRIKPAAFRALILAVADMAALAVAVLLASLITSHFSPYASAHTWTHLFTGEALQRLVRVATMGLVLLVWLWLDIVLLTKTIPVVLSQRGAY